MCRIKLAISEILLVSEIERKCYSSSIAHYLTRVCQVVAEQFHSSQHNIQFDMAKENHFEGYVSTSTTRSRREQSSSLSSISSELISHHECCADVERKVYYFSGSIKPIPRGLNSWSFFTDELRSTMILKWMKYYSWCPQMTRDIDKQHRSQLKQRLNLREGEFAQPLGSFMVTKFKSFQKFGWISGDICNTPVRYLEDTNHWLEASWDGTVGNPSRNHETSDRKLSLKRSAPTLRSERRTRYKLRRETDETTSAVSGPSNRLRSVNPHLPPVHEDLGHIESHTRANAAQSRKDVAASPSRQENNELYPEESSPVNGDIPARSAPVVINLISPSRSDSIHPEHTLIGSPSVQGPGSSNTHGFGSINSGFVPSELCARLKSLSNIVTTDGGQTPESTSLDPATILPLESPESLLKLEKSCRAKCMGIVQEIEDAKSAHNQLCEELETLETEIKAHRKDIEEADKRLKMDVPLTPLGGYEPASSHKLQEVRQKQADPSWVESRKGAKVELSQTIAVMKTLCSDLDERYDRKLMELEQIHGCIREEKARGKKHKTELIYLLRDFPKVNRLEVDTASLMKKIPEIDWNSDDE